MKPQGRSITVMGGVVQKGLGMRRCLVFAAVVCALTMAHEAAAQEPELPAISTERPTVGYSPDLIPRDSFQIENGSAILYQRENYVADLPESLLRLGLTDRFEARFQVSDLYYNSTGSRLEGSDMGISGKLLISGPNSWAPKSAVLGLSLPTGGPSETSGSYDPSLFLIWTQTNSRGYFANELAGVTLTTLNGARRAEWAPSIAGGKSLSAKAGLFAEYAPTVMTDRSVTHVVDGGIAFLPMKLEQIDLRVGWQHDSAGSHGIFSLGYSRRVDSVFEMFAGRWAK
jgi:hypothetical protein